MANYEKLIKKVEEIDPAAAKYLKNEARYLSSFCISGAKNLNTIINWTDTPQGSEFWADLCRKLMAKEERMTQPRDEKGRFRKRFVARVRLVPAGQAPAHKSDLVRVKAYVHLPTGKNTSQLPEDLVFGPRVFCCGEDLNRIWGHWDAKRKSRYRSKVFEGTTWKEAKAEAEAWARTEVNKLKTAIRARRQALVNAGE